MANDLSAVGAAATASKGAAGLKGTDVLTGIRFEKSANGHFILHQSYRREMPADKKSDGCYPCYCPDKTFTFETFDELEKHVRGLLAELKPA